jgi:SAM-dependent methyltransferase
MNRSYCKNLSASLSRDLALLKSTFPGTNEYEEIKKLILKSFRPQKLHVLDIGCGSGKLLYHLETVLRPAGFSISATALDQDTSQFVFRSPETRLVEADFMRYSPESSFDIVLAVHSVYYLGPPKAVLHRIVSICAPAGLTIIIMWSRECTLFKVGSHLRSLQNLQTPAAEDVFDLAKTLSPSLHVSMSKAESEVDVAKWVANPEIGAAAIRILSRTLDKELAVSNLPTLLSCLAVPQGFARRVNGILTISREPAKCDERNAL